MGKLAMISSVRWWRRFRRNVLGRAADRPILPELQRASGPSPWYLRGAPGPAPGFSWEDAGEVGATAGAVVLTGPAGPVLLLDFHNHARIEPFVLDDTLRYIR